MNSETTIKLAKLGLEGDKKAILAYIHELAVESSNKNRVRLYGELTKLINKFEYGQTLATSSSATIIKREESLWFTKGLQRKLDRVISTLGSSNVPQVYKSKYNKVLLYGPPGSGKTTIGNYIADKLDKPIEYIKLSDVISYKFGETLKNLASVFEAGNDSIIFIDEFDAFAKSRFDSNDVGELKRIVNSLIQTLDMSSEDRIVIGATNLRDDIDPAIMRRFPIKLSVPELTKPERMDFFNFLSAQSEMKIEISEKQKRQIEDLMTSLNLKTIDSIKSLFDATAINAHINKKNTVGVSDIYETMITDGILDSRQTKRLQDSNPELVQQVFKELEKKLTKIEIADFMGVHRNSVGHYAK